MRISLVSLFHPIVPYVRVYHYVPGPISGCPRQPVPNLVLRPRIGTTLVYIIPNAGMLIKKLPQDHHGLGLVL